MAVELAHQMREPAWSHADFNRPRANDDAFDQQAHQARLLGGEQARPNAIDLRHRHDDLRLVAQQADLGWFARALNPALEIT